MEDLFRFVMIRQPDEVEADVPSIPLDQPSLFQNELAGSNSTEEAQKVARAFVETEHYVRDVDDLVFGARLLSLADEFQADEELVPAEVRSRFVERLGEELGTVVSSDSWLSDRSRLSDSLVAIKLSSEEHRKPIADYAAVTRMMVLAEQLVAELPTALALGKMLDAGLLLPASFPIKPTSQITVEPNDKDEKDRSEKLEAALEREALLRTALEDLMQVTVDGFADIGDAPTQQETVARPGFFSRVFGGRAGALGSVPYPVGVEESRVLRFEASAAQALTSQTRELLGKLKLDPELSAVDEMAQVLERERAREGAVASELLLSSRNRNVALIGGTPVLVADPGISRTAETDFIPGDVFELSVPHSYGTIKPAGVGELLVVKQQLIRYEGGDLAHIENVLEGETKTREHRRKRTREEFFLEEVETLEEEERDLQSTERFELSRETEETVKQEASAEAGVKVTAKYGPWVEVEGSAHGAVKKSKEKSTKTSSDFSREVVDKSVAKFSEKVRKQRTLRLVEEVEELNKHVLDNPAGNGHVVGAYEWLNKVYEAQVYNYGLRLIYDFVIPEPAAFLIEGLKTNFAEDSGLEKPVPFTLKPSQITASNYHFYVARYQVGGVAAPPDPFVTLSKTLNAGPDDGESPTRGSFVDGEEMIIPDGYQAVYVHVTDTFTFWEQDAAVDVTVGRRTHRFTLNSAWTWGRSLDNELGSIPVAVKTFRAATFSMGIEIRCRRTARALEQWQLDTHGTIQQAFLKLQSEYEEKLEALKIQAGVEIEGRNPELNRAIERDEVKKASISILTQQHYDVFGSVEIGSNGLPQVDLDVADEQGAYVRFFEQAFEWENVTYVLYPYFWGRKNQWIDRLHYEDADPGFMAFIKAGAARVVVPVRPGFEAAVEHFMTTGDVWQGGELPEITDLLFLPIVEELKNQQGAPGDEEPRGEPWLNRVPTTLVRLRLDGSLPEWVKNEEGEYVPREPLTPVPD